MQNDNPLELKGVVAIMVVLIKRVVIKGCFCNGCFHNESGGDAHQILQKDNCHNEDVHKYHLGSDHTANEIVHYVSCVCVICLRNMVRNSF